MYVDDIRFASLPREPNFGTGNVKIKDLERETFKKNLIVPHAHNANESTHILSKLVQKTICVYLQ